MEGGGGGIMDRKAYHYYLENILKKSKYSVVYHFNTSPDEF